MNDTVLMIAVMLPAVLLAASLYWIDIVRRRECLYRWASNEKLKLLAFRYPLLTEASAFPFSISHSQHVFRVEVETDDGVRHFGWVRIGSPWLGLSSSRADVQWDTSEANVPETADSSRLASKRGKR